MPTTPHRQYSLTKITPLLEVFDIDASLKFYCDVLGFTLENISPGRGWAMLIFGDLRLMLNTQYEEDERPNRPPAERSLWHKDTTLYFDCEPQAVYERLRESGWPATEPEITGYQCLQVNAKDPDGFSLAFLKPV